MRLVGCGVYEVSGTAQGSGWNSKVMIDTTSLDTRNYVLSEQINVYIKKLYISSILLAHHIHCIQRIPQRFLLSRPRSSCPFSPIILYMLHTYPLYPRQSHPSMYPSTSPPYPTFLSSPLVFNLPPSNPPYKKTRHTNNKKVEKKTPPTTQH